jgi:putative transcriptional regulator
MKPELEAPCLLIASPSLQDLNFRQSVVLLCQHSADGSLGFVVNRPLDITLGRLLGDETPYEQLREEKAYLGGPVQVNQGTILFRGDTPKEGATAVASGLYLAGSLELIAPTPAPDGSMPPHRFLLGYAGWAGGQLEWEIRNDSWFVGDLDVDEILTTPPEALWERVIGRVGIDPARLHSPGGGSIN